MTVYLYVIERYALAFKSLKDEGVYRPEGVFREAVRPQSVLIAYHHKLEIKMLSDESHASEHTTCELQFCKRVYLLVFWLFDDCTIAVYEQ